MTMLKCKTKSKAGFTLVEIMVSLIVVGMIMAAVALAFNASVASYTANEDMFQAMSAARQAMIRMTSDIRIANTVNDAEPATQCSMFIPIGSTPDPLDQRHVTYQFDGANNLLNLIVHSDDDSPTPAGTYVLCRNVTALTFARTEVPGITPKEIKSVRISMTVTVGSESQTVSSAAVLRRNLEF